LFVPCREAEQNKFHGFRGCSYCSDEARHSPGMYSRSIDPEFSGSPSDGVPRNALCISHTHLYDPNVAPPRHSSSPDAYRHHGKTHGPPSTYPTPSIGPPGRTPPPSTSNSPHRPGLIPVPHDARCPDTLLQPGLWPISQEQLAAEAKSIYEGQAWSRARILCRGTWHSTFIQVNGKT